LAERLVKREKEMKITNKEMEILNEEEKDFDLTVREALKKEVDIFAEGNEGEEEKKESRTTKSRLR